MKEDIFELLRDDHLRLEELFDACEQAQGQELPQDFALLANAILVHAKAEERTFYARLRGALGERVDQLKAEHAEAEEMIFGCRASLGDRELFLAHLQDLRDAIQLHVVEEEGRVFDEARRVFGERGDDLGRMATDFVAAKERIRAGVTMPETPIDTVPGP
jgi:hypothetical protein